jgi:hypothetical protein
VTKQYKYYLAGLEMGGRFFLCFSYLTFFLKLINNKNSQKPNLRLKFCKKINRELLVSSVYCVGKFLALGQVE